MMYAILCYNQEEVTTAWTKDEDDAVMARLSMVHDRLAADGRLGMAARLLPTTTATTVRKNGNQPLVLDGPFAETKEQLLGFYLVDCDDLDAAVQVAEDLTKANPGVGCYELRPVGLLVDPA